MGAQNVSALRAVTPCVSATVIAAQVEIGWSGHLNTTRFAGTGCNGFAVTLEEGSQTTPCELSPTPTLARGAERGESPTN